MIQIHSLSELRKATANHAEQILINKDYLKTTKAKFNLFPQAKLTVFMIGCFFAVGGLGAMLQHGDSFKAVYVAGLYVMGLVIIVKLFEIIAHLVFGLILVSTNFQYKMSHQPSGDILLQKKMICNH
jgi:hypothetical protein